MNPKRLPVRTILITTLLGLMYSARAEFPPYELLGDFPEGNEWEHGVSDVSSDGRVVVGGRLNLITERSAAWQWQEGVGVTVLGFPEEFSAGSHKVSADGSALGGNYTVFTNFPASSFAFRWTSTNGIQNILQGLIQSPGVVILSSGTVGISGDGKVIVGNVLYTTSGIGRARAFRWSAAGLRLLFGPQYGATNENAEVFALSRDGSTTIGRTRDRLDPCRWSATGIVTLLGKLPTALETIPATLSTNGEVIAGISYEPLQQSRPVIWTAGGGPVGINLPAGYTALASGLESLRLTSDGTKLFANLSPNTDSPLTEPFVWTAQNGWQGLGVPPGMNWARMQAISADGATVVGFAGTNAPNYNPFAPDVRHYYWSAAQGWRPVAEQRAVISSISADGQYAVGTIVPPGSTTAKPARWRLTPPERLPVIFLHGVAGSVLKTGNRYIWPTIDPRDVADLHLVNGPADAEAVDAVREYNVGGLGLKRLEFYGPFLQHMTQAYGYVEFDLEEDRSRLTNFFLLNLPATNKPNLFVFPYDWRRPNASHVATLHTFIQRIRELHDGAKVNLVAHSMGGLVMRRYLLEYGTESINRVVTVGSPIWGAPESAFRMFTGIFFPVGPINFVTSSAMKSSVLSMPAVHELNPSTKYLEHWGFPVFTEVDTDYNDNGVTGEGYSANQFRVALDEEAAPQTPAKNNITFHGYLGGRQDDWSQDDGSVDFLHIIGKQAVDVTTVGIEVKAKTFLTAMDQLDAPTLLQVFYRTVGEGDGTVPTLGSQRLPQYYAPGTLVRAITEPLPGVVSEQQPPGRGAEHTMLMSNTNVWMLINEFLDTGKLAAPANGGPTPLAINGTACRQVLVMGCPFISIRDNQATNTLYSPIAAQQIPGVEVIYNDEENWVLVEFDLNRDLVIESAPGCQAIEIEVTDRDAAGDPVGLWRYRAAPGTNRWQLALANTQPPALAKDANGDGLFTPAELIAPSHAADGPGTDVKPPELEVLLSRLNGQIQLILNGSDAKSPPVTIRYRLNGGPLMTYGGAVLFPGDAQHTIDLFAEDALGNTSGLIQTRLNPEMKIGRSANGSILLQWPVADGYQLESAPGPQGPWTAVAGTRIRSNGVVTVEATPSAAMSVFRLKR